MLLNSPPAEVYIVIQNWCMKCWNSIAITWNVLRVLHRRWSAITISKPCTNKRSVRIARKWFSSNALISTSRNSTMRATRSSAICADEYRQLERSIKATTAKSIKCMPNYNVTFASAGKLDCCWFDHSRSVSLNTYTKPYHCRLKHRDALKGHMLRHVQGPQKCTICGHISPNRKALGKHKQTHNPKRKERFKCTTCGKGCRDKMSLLVNATNTFPSQWFPHLSAFWTCRNIHTSIPVSLAHTIAKIAAKYSDSAHHFVCTKRKCIQNKNRIRPLDSVHTNPAYRLYWISPISVQFVRLEIKIQTNELAKHFHFKSITYLKLTFQPTTTYRRWHLGDISCICLHQRSHHISAPSRDPEHRHIKERILAQIK